MLKLRAWNESDSVFVCYLRNNPENYRWYRQDKPISLKEQKQFIRKNIDYHGYIVEENNKPIGIAALKYVEDGFGICDSYSPAELCLVQEKFNPKILDRLFELEKPSYVFAPVFAKNPILKDLLNYGFTVRKIEERAYWKKDQGFVDTITLELKCEY